MSKKEEAEAYPLKSLHEFLTELDKEWGKFRTGSMIGIITSGVLLFFFLIRFLGLLWRIRHGLALIEALDELLFLILVAVFVTYEMSLLLRQYKFFTKWERRMGLLLHLEERLLEGTEGKSEGT